MYPAWTKHLKTDADKTRFEKVVKGSKPTLERLVEILDEYETELDNQETNPDIYQIPNWDYKQADNNGARRILKRIKKLIDLNQQKSSETKEST